MVNLDFRDATSRLILHAFGQRRRYIDVIFEPLSCVIKIFYLVSKCPLIAFVSDTPTQGQTHSIKTGYVIVGALYLEAVAGVAYMIPSKQSKAILD